jgi:small conductance mechanosensitive channel
MMPTQLLIVDLFVRYGFQVLGAVVIMAVGALVARWIGGLINARLQRYTMEPPLRILIVRVARVVVMLLALLVALDKFGFQVAPLVAGIGIAGLGIGIALQGVFGNIIAGLTIIFTRPFRVGEYVELLGVHGEVMTIELFSTTLRHPDHSRVIVPNRKIVGEILHNFGTTRQLRLAVTVPHDADLARAIAAAHDVLAANARVLREPAAIVGVDQVGESAIRISVRPWVRVPDAVATEIEINQMLVERLREHGVEFPVPHYEVRLLDGAAAATARQ